MKIAHAQGGDWKTEVLKYVAAYRAKPHPSTGKSPAEMLFGRKVRTKIPEFTLRSVENDQDVRDRDSEEKGKAKLYADSRRNARESDIQVGDSVLLKCDRVTKLDTPFRPEPFQVVARSGSRVKVESPQGVLIIGTHDL